MTNKLPQFILGELEEVEAAIHFASGLKCIFLKRGMAMGTTEDKLEIMDLILRYSHAADGTDPAAFADLFTEDGVANFVRMNRVMRGRAELIAFVTPVIEMRGQRQLRHYQSPPIFLELTEESARTSNYLLLTVAESGKGTLVSQTGVYEDEIVRTPKGWRFKTRKFIADTPPPNA